MAKVKNYVSDNPKLMAEWDFSKNELEGLHPEQFSIRSSVSVWWICGRCGNSFKAKIYGRIKSTGCRKCLTDLRTENLLQKRESFADKNPHLIIEWHPIKNGDIRPDKILADSREKYWWICDKGHEWQATANNRNHGKGCPICANQQVLKGYNDLESQYPDLAKEWHPTKNGSLRPSEILCTSNKKVWWVCDKKHEWQAAISDRSRIGLGCPYCSNQKLLKGYNDLATVNPDLAKQWHPTKNENITPDMVQAGSNKKAWWVCDKGHEWQAVISTRNHGVGCPHCKKELNTSFPEQAIYYYFDQLTSTENRYLYDGKNEIDVFLTEFNIGIEYDGVYFHNKERAKKLEIQKNKILKDSGIKLLRVKEINNLEETIDSEDVFYYKYTADALNLGTVINKLIMRVNQITGLSFSVDINIDRDRAIIYERYIDNEKKNSLLYKRPLLAAEWHPTKNGRLLPEMVTPHSNKIVWWKCQNGHEWKTGVNHRSNGSGCPICSNKKVLKGYNDLQTRYPNVAAEWHPTKNGLRTPEDVLPFSNKKAWWLCNVCGNEWQATINSRSTGNGCPCCKGSKIGKKRVENLIKKEGSLESRNPELAAEWHPTKNENLLPSQVTFGSGKKAWWKCKNCGHEWQAVIGSRNKGAGCPKCRKKKK